jgi:hypothetical protein
MENSMKHLKHIFWRSPLGRAILRWQFRRWVARHELRDETLDWTPESRADAIASLTPEERQAYLSA